VPGTPPDNGWRSNLDSSSEGEFDSAQEPKPWFLQPWVLAVWGALVLALIAVIIYGLLELARGSGANKPVPSKPSTTATTTTTSSTRPPTTTSTTASSTPPESSTDSAPPGTASPTRQHQHHHWRTDLPTTRLPSFPP
jgi:cytoskeletal protein RodZ